MNRTHIFRVRAGRTKPLCYPSLKVAEARRLERRCPEGRLVSTEEQYHYATLPFESGRRWRSRTSAFWSQARRATVILISDCCFIYSSSIRDIWTRTLSRLLSRLAEVEGYDPSKLLTENQATLPILSTPPLAAAAGVEPADSSLKGRRLSPFCLYRRCETAYRHKVCL